MRYTVRTNCPFVTRLFRSATDPSVSSTTCKSTRPRSSTTSSMPWRVSRRACSLVTIPTHCLRARRTLRAPTRSKRVPGPQPRRSWHSAPWAGLRRSPVSSTGVHGSRSPSCPFLAKQNLSSESYVARHSSFLNLYQYLTDWTNMSFS